jgi:hypothetical protein
MNVEGRAKLSLFKVAQGSGGGTDSPLAVIDTVSSQAGQTETAAEPAFTSQEVELLTGAFLEATGSHIGKSLETTVPGTGGIEDLQRLKGGHHSAGLGHRKSQSLETACRRAKQGEKDPVSVDSHGRKPALVAAFFRNVGPRRDDADDASFDEGSPVRLRHLIAKGYLVAGLD